MKARHKKRKISAIVAILVVLGVLIFSIWRESVRRAAAADEKEIVSCLQDGVGSEDTCWDAVITRDLDADKLTLALKQLDSFLRESPSFISTCHTYAHRVGERAYADYAQGKRIEASAAMQVCDFGFYHGFMTAFLTQSKDFKKLGEFCISTQGRSQLGENTYSRDACFHGIGHGSAASHSAAEWKNPMPLLSEAMTICHAAAGDANDFVKCAAGAYNGMSYSPYKDEMDPNDPFKICREVPSDYIPAECYANLASDVFNLTPHKTIQEAVDLAARFAPEKYMLRAIPTFANMAARQKGSEERSLATCVKLDAEKKKACLNGFVIGLVQSAPSDKKQEHAYAFCSSAAFPDDQRVNCFSSAFSELLSFWTKNKIDHSCSMVSPANKDVCGEALAAWHSQLGNTRY